MSALTYWGWYAIKQKPNQTKQNHPLLTIRILLKTFVLHSFHRIWTFEFGMVPPSFTHTYTHSKYLRQFEKLILTVLDNGSDSSEK